MICRVHFFKQYFEIKMSRIKQTILRYYKKKDLHSLANFANRFFNKVEVNTSDSEANQLYIFYHLYLLNNWDDLFLKYLNVIRQSELQSKTTQILVCAIYHNKDELNRLKTLLESHPKTSLYYSRKHSDLPVKIWNDPETYIDTNLGEGESILKMIQHAKSHSEKSNYIFLHSKGVTNPKNRERRQISYFLKNGLQKEASNEEMSEFITNKIIEKTIKEWQHHIEALKQKHFYYFVWNIFWARSEFLRRFDFEEFNSKGQFPKEYTLSNRHWSAIFPINLYGAIYGKRMIGLRNIIDLYL